MCAAHPGRSCAPSYPPRKVESVTNAKETAKTRQLIRPLLRPAYTGAMAGNPRISTERDRLEAQAIALRREDVPMAEVERITGVPASTLYQWAQRGGWRRCDLERERVEAAMKAEAEAEEAGGAAPPRSADGSDGEDGGDLAGVDRGGVARGGGDREGDASLSGAALRAEADRCARAAIALSRGGRLKEAESALKLAERYRDSAGAGSGEGGWEERVSLELEARILAERDGLRESCRSWVRLALEGRIASLPHWATTKAFLAGTPYADQYYRCGGVGTGIAGHFGPGPADRLHEAEREADEAGESGGSGGAGGAGGAGAS